MSDLISRSALLTEIRKRCGMWKKTAEIFCEVIEKQPPVEAVPAWIPCSERMPKERDSIFKKAKGTDKWSPAMFEGISDEVNVTVEFEDGTRTTKTSHTLDGKWKCEKDYGVKMKVIAWMPSPDPYKADMRKKV